MIGVHVGGPINFRHSLTAAETSSFKDIITSNNISFVSALRVTLGFPVLQQVSYFCVGGHDAVNTIRLPIPHRRKLPMTRNSSGSTDSK